MLFRTESKCRILGIALAKAVAVSVILLYTGFSNRISPEYIGNDGRLPEELRSGREGLKWLHKRPSAAGEWISRAKNT